MVTVLIGRVRTVDASQPHAEAIAFEGERIVAVGSRESVLEAAGPHAEVLRFAEQTIAPGFIDAHHHVAITALYDGATRLIPPRVTDVRTLQQALRESARSLPEGRWLVATHWDESLLQERRPPTREELDEALPDRPAFLLHHTCHRALANTRALELAGIDAKTPDPHGGVIVRGKSGIPNGLLIERGMSPVESLARLERAQVDREGALSRMAAHYQSLARSGVTRVCDAAVPRELVALFQALIDRGAMAVPTHVCPVSMRGWLEEPTDALDGPPTGDEARGLFIGPVKLIFDGAPGCSMCLSWGQMLGTAINALGLSLRRGTLDPIRTALSVAPRLGRKLRTGIAIYDHQSARRVVGAAIERGFSVATHAIGNAAIDVALDAYQHQKHRLHHAGTARVEHASYASHEQLARMADLGAAAVVQPAMIEMHMIAHAARIPGLPFIALQSLHRAGVTVVGSSDYPVHTFDPLAGIRAACARVTETGPVIDPEERVTVDEALAMYTINAARVLGCDKDTGSLVTGKRADIVVIDGELGAKGAAVEHVWIGGERRC